MPRRLPTTSPFYNLRQDILRLAVCSLSVGIQTLAELVPTVLVVAMQFED